LSKYKIKKQKRLVLSAKAFFLIITGVQALHLFQKNKPRRAIFFLEPRRGLEGASPTPSFDM